MTQLQELSYFGQTFGNIKPEIRNLKNLSYINLSHCGLQELPEEFYELINLDWLDLNGNNLSNINSKIGDFVITSYSIHYTKLYEMYVFE